MQKYASQFLSSQKLSCCITQYALQGQPFFCILNFDQTEGYFLSSPHLQSQELLFSFPRSCNYRSLPEPTFTLKSLNPRLPPYEEYLRQFNLVQKALRQGDTFLLNLSVSSPLNPLASLLQIFQLVESKYKVYLADRFVSFSPETFIQIDAQGKISTYPMKGTIDASIPNAKTLLLQDEKEIAEHHTIVDLMRNDLSQVASKVRVEKFRYLESIFTQKGGIHQTSSHISGQLPENYLSYLGEIILKLLPAGSVSGAPKSSTLRIIRDVETHDRGYYTGVAIYFDGQQLDSCVLIRFIEKYQDQLVYKSGGGITLFSQAKQEYQEILDKIYLPVSIKKQQCS
ncbi:MAG: aminodeoxychorismate synthase component I [Neisseriaceae bacterium]